MNKEEIIAARIAFFAMILGLVGFVAFIFVIGAAA